MSKYDRILIVVNYDEWSSAQDSKLLKYFCQNYHENDVSLHFSILNFENENESC